jgi:hypothetical protein
MVANNDIRDAMSIIDAAALNAAAGQNQTAANAMRRAADYLSGAADRLREKAHKLSSLPSDND